MDKDFIPTLKEHGLEVTYYGLAICQALHSATEHPSAEEIYQQVRKRFPLISLKTVDKILKRFIKAGLAQTVTGTKETARYCVLK